MSIDLNKKQLLAVEKINQFICQQVKSIFYLLGYAGTGKTFLIGQVIKNFLNESKMDHIYVCAPTHQALNVIESALKSNLILLTSVSPSVSIVSPLASPVPSTIPNNHGSTIDLLSKISFMTIHKLLDFRPVICFKDGSKDFKSVKESKFLKQIKPTLIVIDECSMISKQMVLELQKYVDLYPMIKIIYMGDDHQLPPVCESQSLIFVNIPKQYEYLVVLDEVMRTKSTDIKDVCHIIRTWNKTDNLIKLILPIHNRKTTPKTFKLYHKNPNYTESKWFKYVVKKIDSGEIPIILTWKNDTVDFYNMAIRKYIHKTSVLNTFVIGDYVIFNNFYSSVEGEFFYTSNMIKIIDIKIIDQLLYNWTELIIPNAKTIIEKNFNVVVKKLANQQCNFKINIFIVNRINNLNDSMAAAATTTISPTKQKSCQVQTIDCTDIKQYDIMINTVKEHIEFFYNKYHAEKLTSKLWQKFHTKLIDPYAQIKFGYSTTVYKAQGSSLATVLVDLDDIYSCNNAHEYQLALYTAASRASSELIFLV